MSSSPLSPTTPSSTLRSPFPLSKDSLEQQLVLEGKLQEVGEQLLELYKNTRQWNQVGQLAQTLSSNSDRQVSLCRSINGPAFSFSMENIQSESYCPLTVDYEQDGPHWVIKLANSQPVRRTLEDINHLKSSLSTGHSLRMSLSPEEENSSCTSLQEFLTSAMKDEVIKQDHLLNCFLSAKVEDFSVIFNKSSAVDEGAAPNENGFLNDQCKEVESSQQGDENEDSKDENEESKVTSSGLSIDELEESPQAPKRLASPPHFITTGQSSTEPSVVAAESSAPMSPPVAAVEHILKSVVTKSENSSDEVCSAVDEVTSGSEPTKSTVAQGGASPKPRSKSVFYDASSPDPPTASSTSKSLKKKFSKSRKSKKQVDDNSVSLATPQLTVNWDPTCLLEELYSDCRPGLAHSSANENSRHSGYLDKLPVNQRKPTVMKGWKHRFFRVTRGSLFYYDDETSTKATSFIRLSDSKIVQHPESLKLEIIEKGGNFIMLRAESREELTDWSRFLQLEAVHPTMTHRPSLSPTRSAPILIVDMGACSLRAGIAQNDTYPQLFFPTVCAISDDRIIACGNEAFLPGTRSQAKLIYPCRRRIRLDASLPVRECFQYIVEKVCKILQVEPQNSSALVCVSSVMPEAEQTSLAEVFLEVLGFKSILIQEQTTMALYSYNNTSGIVVNIGDSTDVVPIIDGFKVDAGTSHTPFGGHLVTENLSKLATSKDIRYFSEAEMFIVRYIKENICFLSQDYSDDCIRCEESPAEYVRAVDVDRFQLPDHRKVMHLDLELFKSPEGLFTPGIWGKDVVGLHEMVQKAVEHCPIDMRREMARHIYLAGGTTLLIGLQERLQKELEHVFPRMEVQIHGSENRQHAAFLGAGVLASLNSFTKSLVDLETWVSKGLTAMRHSDA